MSLHMLPTELIHRIFDFCNIQTILNSIRYVCRHLYASVNTYHGFELTFSLNSKSELQKICQIMSIERVASLNIVRGRMTEINVFYKFPNLIDLLDFVHWILMMPVTMDSNDFLAKLLLNPWSHFRSPIANTILLKRVQLFRQRSRNLNFENYACVVIIT